ncbi:UvrD-helicase domain-containing protein [Micromonospora sp. WMMD754]|uniref:UvrD-helicase domain-containing protein n=1 Tax=Micromonospora sp. WMMD754 TaxID=3404114 RepID=UPI003BF4946B
MPALAVAKDAMRDYAKLTKPIRDKVDALFEKFQAHTFAGIHLEKLTNARDPRLRTVRVDEFWRGLVLAPETGDTYVLTRIVTHDEADRWAPRHVFKVNATHGALEIIDVASVEQISPTPAPVPSTGALLDGISDATLQAVGVDDVYLPMLRLISNEAQLLSYLPALPELQQQAVSLLLAGMDSDAVLDQITGGALPEQVDVEDIDAALARPASASNFLVTVDDATLREALDQPFDLWRTFLHPQQRSIAYRHSYRGPVRVTGGAGTGKTVLAIHRAQHLARTHPDAEILLTTFTTTLAEELRSALGVLGGSQLAERIQVSTVDAMAHAVARQAGQAPTEVLLDREEMKLWGSVTQRTRAGQGRFSPEFLRDEWRQVILAQDLADLPAYLGATRNGRGVRLSRTDREAVWRAVEEFDRLRAGVPTILQVAAQAIRLLTSGTVPSRYAHILVDEAQDLHPVQWRLLRAAVPPGPDDLFIVGDAHQRIYDNRVTLSGLGIEVRGRAHRLTVSYRTTAEILQLSTRLLGAETYDNFDGGLDSMAGYHSPLRGPSPDLDGFDNRDAELRDLVTAVRLWLESGVQPHDIAVLSRTKRQSEEAVGVLTAEGLHTVRLKSAGRGRPEAIQVMTMHRAKGLEFRCVAVQGASAEMMPLAGALTPARADAARHRQDQMRERSLFFVACTRARDALRISWTGQPSPFLPVDGLR